MCPHKHKGVDANQKLQWQAVIQLQMRHLQVVANSYPQLRTELD
jgi:hypothetical protein